MLVAGRACLSQSAMSASARTSRRPLSRRPRASSRMSPRAGRQGARRDPAGRIAAGIQEAHRHHLRSLRAAQRNHRLSGRYRRFPAGAERQGDVLCRRQMAAHPCRARRAIDVRPAVRGRQSFLGASQSAGRSRAGAGAGNRRAAACLSDVAGRSGARSGASGRAIRSLADDARAAIDRAVPLPLWGVRRQDRCGGCRARADGDPMGRVGRRSLDRRDLALDGEIGRSRMCAPARS